VNSRYQSIGNVGNSVLEISVVDSFGVVESGI